MKPLPDAQATAHRLCAGTALLSKKRISCRKRLLVDRQQPFSTRLEGAVIAAGAES